MRATISSSCFRLVLAIAFLFSQNAAFGGTSPPAYDSSLTITYPGNGVNLTTGATFNVLGNVIPARRRNVDDTAWVVILPRVLCEIFFTQDEATFYLMNSSTTSVSFPSDISANGVFDGTLTATQQGNFIDGYYVDATALDQFNNVTNVVDTVAVAITKPGS